MQFIAAVNRVLRNNGIIRGDDDDITSFSDTQHSATVSMARIAIEDQLASLVSNQIIPLEEKQATIEYVAGQRLYTLASDFVRMQQNFLIEVDGTGVSENKWVREVDEAELRASVGDYQSVQGDPSYFYFTGGAAKNIGLYQVPQASGQQARYYYEADVLVSDAADELPFLTSLEDNTFVRIASRHFELLFEGTSDIASFERDPIITGLQGTLMNLMNPKALTSRYGR